MKSIKEKSDEYLQQEKDEIVSVYDRYAGFVDGAIYVLDAIEEFMVNLNLGNNPAEKFYKLDFMADIHEFIEQLKSNQ